MPDEILHKGIASISQVGAEKFPELRAIPSTVSQLTLVGTLSNPD
jgi:hypothetical protein